MKKYVKVDPKFFRPAEKIKLCGNPHKSEESLGWLRTRRFKEVIQEMVEQEKLLFTNSSKS